MTVDEVNERIAELRGIKDDPEAAHILEDTIMDEVLQAIARGAEDPAGLALAALATQDVEFSRWYA